VPDLVHLEHYFDVLRKKSAALVASCGSLDAIKAGFR
jgi:hypothetical protein